MAEAATEEPKQEAEETTQEEPAEQAQEEPAQEASAEEEQKQEEKGQQEERELLTLSEVSDRTGISMPTLQRYKKNYQDRLPTVGKGRTQKYPVESLPVFQQIKKENIKKRGRPRKKGKKKSKKPAPARKDLLTLTEIGERTGISYPTLVRYAKLHLDRIPHEGEGRRRRYYPEAVEVFQQIRGESRRGRKKSTGAGKGTSAADKSLARRVQALERSHKALEKQIKALIKDLRKPMTVTVQRNR